MGSTHVTSGERESEAATEPLPIPCFRASGESLAYVVEEAAIGAFTGASGLGRRTSLDHWLALGNRPVIRFRSAVETPRFQVLGRLVHELKGMQEASEEFELIEETIASIRASSPVLRFDLVQRQPKEVLRLFFYLWERTGAPLVLSGDDVAWERIRRDSALAAQVEQQVEFVPLNKAEVATFIPRLHPLLARSKEELLVEADDLHCHGYIGRWARFTRRAVSFAGNSTPSLTRELMQRTIASLPRLD